MRPSIAAMAGAALLAGCQPRPPSVTDAWIRLPAVSGNPGAAYFVLHGGQTATTLAAVKTPAAIRSELHESMAGHGKMMTMAPLKQVAVPSGEEVKFAPGGRHVMLFDIAPTLKAGTTARLRFEFLQDTPIEVDARVVAAGDPAP